MNRHTSHLGGGAQDSGPPGVSWQIVPTALGAMLQDKDPVKAQRAMLAMLGTIKLDIAAMRKAFAGR